MLMEMALMFLFLHPGMPSPEPRYGPRQRGSRLVQGCHEAGFKPSKETFCFYFYHFLEYPFDISIGGEVMSVKKKICLSAGQECFSGRSHFGSCGSIALCQQVYLNLKYNETHPTTIRVPNGCQCVQIHTQYS